MNSKSEQGKNGSKKSTAASKRKTTAPKSKTDLFDDSFEEDGWEQSDADEFGFDASLSDEPQKIKKRSGNKKDNDDLDFNFEDDFRGLGFLDDSFYDDEDDLY